MTTCEPKPVTVAESLLPCLDYLYNCTSISVPKVLKPRLDPFCILYLLCFKWLFSELYKRTPLQRVSSSDKSLTSGPPIEMVCVFPFPWRPLSRWLLPRGRYRPTTGSREPSHRVRDPETSKWSHFVWSPSFYVPYL